MNRKIGLVFSYGVMITEIVSAMFVTRFYNKSRSGGVRYLPAHFVNNRISDYILDLGVDSSVIRIYGEISVCQ